MKYLLPVLLATAAGWVATKDSRWASSSPAPESARTAASLSVDPPWLTGAAEVETEGADESADDPHAGLYAADPHAEVYAGDPHAGLYADEGSLEAADEVPSGMCTRDADFMPQGDEGAAGDPHAQAAIAAVEPPREPLTPSSAPNGHAIEDIFSHRAELAGTAVRVRGTVVKRTDGVLGKTYLHLRDGSGAAERADDDLTVTTTEDIPLGEIVELEGQLEIDQDVGVGYSYPALLSAARRVASR